MEFAAAVGIRSPGIETYPSQESPTEDALMARYAAGDDLAFQPLCALLAPRIRAFFMRSFADPALADSLVEATFARLRHGRSSYRPELSLKAWVFMMAAGVRRDELQRRYGPGEDVPEADFARPASPPPEEPGPGDARAVDAARAAIDALPESQRVVVHLHLSEHLAFEQIAEILGTTPEVVRRRARAAYAQLQHELKNFVRSTNWQ